MRTITFESETHVTKVSGLNGMNESNPLNRVMMAVEKRANQLPHG